MSIREIDAITTRFETHIEVTFERLKSVVVRCLFVAMIYGVAMQAIVTAIVNDLQHR